MIQIDVECYSGFKGQERPVRFTLGEHTLQVDEVEDQWYSPGARFFRVRASDGNVYVLRHEEGQDVWTLDVYRTGP